MSDPKDNQDKPAAPAAEPPGEGDSIDDAAREAVREMERRGRGHAGNGDIG